MATEIEIKLTAGDAMLGHLRDHPALTGAETRSTLVTTYFDTVGGRLGRRGATLRVREDGGSPQQTLKLASRNGGSVRRGEWNTPVSGLEPETHRLPKKARSRLEHLIDDAHIVVLGTMRVERTVRRIGYRSSTIELAFDSGTIEADTRREPVGELELELVDGSLADVLDLALELPLGPELRWSILSKGDRCYALAFDTPPAAVKAGPAASAKGTDATSGFQTIAWACLEHFLANYALVIETGDADAVHQSRVALRRLRAAFTLFGSLVADDVAPILRTEIKAVAACLGEVRDLDVLIERLENSDPTAAGGEPRDHSDELLAHLAVRRQAAIDRARAMLCGAPLQRLLVRCAHWIEAGPWLAAAADHRGDEPIARFARSVLKRRRRKLRRVNDDLGQLGDEERHELRIEVKKLRYAGDFFGPMLGARGKNKHGKAFLKAVSRLQEALGTLNDVAVAEAGRDALFDDVEPLAAARLAAQLALSIESAAPARDPLLRAAERNLAAVKTLPAWWKSR
ncbi:MAG: CHAD domain-containing protein [Novosphingobium sp.]